MLNPESRVRAEHPPTVKEHDSVIGHTACVANTPLSLVLKGHQEDWPKECVLSQARGEARRVTVRDI